MELLELLKTLNDQSNQADVQAQIDTLRDAIVMLDAKISFTWWILFLIIVAFGILNFFCFWRLDKRLKKNEWNVEKLDRKVWPEYYQAKDEAEAREKFNKEVLLNKVSCVEKPGK